MNFKVGQKVKFKGYSELQEGQEPILTPGQLVKIRSISETNDIIIDVLDDKGNVIDNVSQTETLWPEEIEMIEDADAPEGDAGNEEVIAADPVAAAEAAEDAAPAPKTKGKAKGKAKAEEAPKAEAKIIAPKAKGKADTKVDAKAETKPKAKVEAPAANTQDVDEERGALSSELVRAALASVAGEDGGGSALDAALYLKNKEEELYYTLGGVLQHIKETGIYKSLGYDGKRGFADYVQKELRTEYRKAQYLIDIFDKVNQSGVDEKRLGEIGWSKAKEIMRVAQISMDTLASDFDELVDFAKEHSRDDLMSHIETTYEGIKRRQAAEPAEKVQQSSFIFKLSAEEAASATAAMDSAKKLAGTDDMNKAFAYVLSDWSLMTEGTQIDLETAIATIETRFGVTLRQAEADEADETASEEALETA